MLLIVVWLIQKRRSLPSRYMSSVGFIWLANYHSVSLVVWTWPSQKLCTYICYEFVIKSITIFLKVRKISFEAVSEKCLDCSIANLKVVLPLCLLICVTVDHPWYNIQEKNQFQNYFFILVQMTFVFRN